MLTSIFRGEGMIRSIFILTILFFMLPSGTAGAEDADPPKGAFVAEETGAAVSADNLVVARVSGDPITEKQVLDAINELASRENMSIEQSRQRNSLLFDRAVESLVTISLLKMRMRDMHVAVDEADVDKQFRQMAQRFPSSESFKKSLAGQGMTEADLTNQIRENLKLQKVIDEASKGAATVTETDMEKFYAANPGRFIVDERARVAHILLKIPPDATAAQKEDIRKKLEGIRIEIEADMITFEAAAAKYSEDEETAQKGGDMGLMMRGNMPKNFSDFLFRIKPGTVTPALESRSGYHILTALELLPAGQASMKEVAPTLRQYLEQNAKQAAMQKFADELKSKAVIEYFMTSDEFVKHRN